MFYYTIKGFKYQLSKDNIGVKSNVGLPTVDSSIGTLTWGSNHDALKVEGNIGVVTRPQSSNVTVILTATLEKGSEKESRPFTLIILKQDGEVVVETDIDKAIKNLQISFAEGETKDTVKTDFNLPTIDSNVGALTWISSHEALKVENGKAVVTRQAADQQVTLTALIKKDSETKTKDFNIVVLKKDGEVIVETEIEKAIKALELTFKAGETKDSVQSDFDLPTIDSNVGALTWISSHEALRVENGKAVVTRQAADQQVKLTASIEKGTEKKTKDFNIVILKKDVVVEEIVKLYEFDFATSSLGTSYSSNQDKQHTILNKVDQKNVNVISTRGAANNNHSTITDFFLVLSGATKEGTKPAYVSFSLEKEITKLTLEAAIWSTFDVEKLTKFSLQIKQGGNWVDHTDILAKLNGSLSYVSIEILEINAKELRLYVEGDAVDAASPGNNGSRVLIDNLVLYGLGTDPVDPVDPVDPIDPVDPVDPIDPIDPVDPVDPSKQVVETFDNLDIAGNSYVAGTFTGVNGIVWEYVGSRGDYEGDGKAISFGSGANRDNSSLKATITGGISSLSFDLYKQESNARERKVEVFINGTSYGVFTLDNNVAGKQTFTVQNVDVSGSFTIEFKHVTEATGTVRSQFSIDNITWTPKG